MQESIWESGNLMMSVNLFILTSDSYGIGLPMHSRPSQLREDEHNNKNSIWGFVGLNVRQQSFDQPGT